MYDVFYSWLLLLQLCLVVNAVHLCDHLVFVSACDGFLEIPIVVIV